MSSQLPQLVLASGSPRRRELLAMLGVEFSFRAPDVDESQCADEGVEPYVERLARSKALGEVHPGELVLAADTSVVSHGIILGKPRDRRDATQMLQQLQGRTHHVFTGVAAARMNADGEAEIVAEICRSAVTFRPMSQREIAWYVATAEGSDKAGGYAVQGIAGLFIGSIEGNYHNIVGLPLTTLSDCISQLGFELLAWRRGS